jgi:hypothetical protein
MEGDRMERPRLTEFLLRLATDMETQAKFRHSKSEAVEMMEEAGITCEQQEAVLSGETRRVQEAVILETGDLLPAMYCGKVRQHLFEFEVVDDAE